MQEEHGEHAEGTPASAALWRFLARQNSCVVSRMPNLYNALFSLVKRAFAVLGFRATGHFLL